MHLARVITAFVLLPLVLLLILKGSDTLLRLVAGLCAALAWHELARMAGLGGAVFLAGLLTLALGFWGLGAGPAFIPLALWLGLFLFLLCFLKDYSAEGTLKDLSLAFAGLTYVLCGFGHLFLLTTLNDGRAWLLFLLAAIFGTDTGAYYTGKTLGRHKLIPKVSPGKTWEGAIGGTLLGMCLSGVVGHFFKLGAPALILILAFFLSVVGQFGDLLESLIKRGLGVKDSGAILPGHGGILDRTDALIFAAPFLYWFFWLRTYGA